MDVFDSMGLSVAEMLVPWIAILVSISAAFWFKDFATNLMQGLKLDLILPLTRAIVLLSTVMML